MKRKKTKIGIFKTNLKQNYKISHQKNIPSFKIKKENTGNIFIIDMKI